MKLSRTNIILKLSFYFIIIGITTISCDTVIGTSIYKAKLEDKTIHTVKDLSLNKGDVIVLWAHYNLSYKEEMPLYRLKYHIEQDDNTVLFDEFNLLENIEYSFKPIIRSSKNTDRTYTAYDDNGDEIEKKYTEWDFQQEEHKFIIEKDGNYSFDFKLYNDGKSFLSDDISVIIRKL